LPAHPASIVLTTLAADFVALSLARSLVEERLAACVSILPGLDSVYRWLGGVEQDREQQILIKTTPDRLAALESRLRQIHPYDVPELLVLDVERGGADYLAWVRESVGEG
jgi:periplasmic divalent cation tolerance protein